MYAHVFPPRFWFRSNASSQGHTGNHKLVSKPIYQPKLSTSDITKALNRQSVFDGITKSPCTKPAFFEPVFCLTGIPAGDTSPNLGPSAPSPWPIPHGKDNRSLRRLTAVPAFFKGGMSGESCLAVIPHREEGLGQTDSSTVQK
jgi:hypothetical protein